MTGALASTRSCESKSYLRSLESKEKLKGQVPTDFVVTGPAPGRPSTPREKTWMSLERFTVTTSLPPAGLNPTCAGEPRSEGGWVPP